MILVVDDTPLFRDPIAACLKLAGYPTCCASDGQEALVLIRAKAPDLILLDLAMPRMDGLSLLRQMRSDARMAKIPVILLTAAADKQSVLQAAKLGIADYLLKSQVSSDQLVERVRQKLNGKVVPSAAPATNKPSIAPAPAPAAGAASQTVARLMDGEECARRIRSSEAAKALSGVVSQVISAANSPTADMAEMASLVSRDAALSARLLSVAASSAYSAGHRRISTVTDAVRRIGCSGIRTIAAAVGVFDALPSNDIDGFNPLRAWQHSFAVAKLCEQLAQPRGGNDAALAYSVGLCHDLGDIVYHSQFAEEHRQVLEAQKLTGRPRDELERDMLGMTRRRMTLTIIQSLGLPEPIASPILAFWDGKPARPGGSPLSEVLRIAEHYANALLLTNGDDAMIAPLGRSESRTVLGDEQPPRPDGRQIRAEVLALMGAVARLSPAQEKQLNQPPFPIDGPTVWLAREESFSALDPVEILLSSLGSVDVHDSLPTPAEIGEHRALVVISRSTTGQFNAIELAKALETWPSGKPPMLWLAATTEKNPNPAHPCPLKWPLRIADFVAALRPSVC